MQDHQKVLRVYAAHLLEEEGLSAEKEVLDFISTHIQLSEGASNEEGEDRSTHLKEDTDGKVTAKQFDLYNTIDIKFYDIAGLGIDAMAILALPVGAAIKALIIILKLIYKFYGKLEYEFNQTDARILLAIFLTRKKTFSLDEIKEEYLKKFKEEIQDERLDRAISFFRKKDMLRYPGNNIYKLVERVSYDRDY